MKTQIILTIIIVVLFAITPFSQTIVNLSDFQPNYNVNKKEISLSGGNPNILKQFLHELGHHVWFYGGVDTVAYRETFKDENIWERFATEHYNYFLGETDYYNKEVFDKFYNRDK